MSEVWKIAGIDGIVHHCVNLGWGAVNVAEELGRLTGLTVRAGNDANVAALREMWQGGTGIVRVAKRKLARTSEEITLRKYDDLTAKDVFDEARAGDVIALGLVDEVCEILGAALSNIACVVNPEVIVIGGGVSKAGDVLIGAINKRFVETAFHACRDTRFVLPGLGNDAGMYGCVQMLLD